MKQDAKRARDELSTDSEIKDFEKLKTQTIGAVTESINNALPKLMSKLQSSMTETLKRLVSSAVIHMKNKIMASVNQKCDQLLAKLNFKTLSAAKLVKAYKRRDNIKILVVPKKNYIEQRRQKRSRKTTIKQCGNFCQVQSR